MFETKNRLLYIFFIIFMPFHILNKIFYKVKGLENARIFGFLMSVFICGISIIDGFDQFIELLPISLFFMIPFWLIMYLICNILFTIVGYIVSMVGYLITYGPNYFCQKYAYLFRKPRNLDECIKSAATFRKFNIESFPRKFGPNPSCWYKYGSLYFFGNQLMNENRTFYISDIKGVGYIPLPIKKISEYECVATVCLTLTLKDNRVVYIRLSKEHLKYYVQKKEVKFYYPDHFKYLIMMIRRGISDGNFEFVRQEQRKKEAEQHKKKEEKKKEYKKTESNDGISLKVREALTFFKLDINFTEAELKKNFYKLCKVAHPDENRMSGDEFQKQININRDILEQFLKERKRYQ